MKIFVRSFLASFAVAATGKATLEFNVANDSGSGSDGSLKLYLGRNCETNVVSGRICDFKYLQDVSGFRTGNGGRVDLTEEVDPDNDQLFMTFRSDDEVIFNELKLSVVQNGSNRLINLLKMDGMRDDNLAFDYDTKNYPCQSSYPRHTKCCFDNIFDFYTMKMKPHYSLLTGHVVKRTIDDFNIQVPKYGRNIRSTTTQLILKTGNDRLDGSNDPLMIYYGQNCDKNICNYEKVAQLIAKDRGTEYSLYLPDFDWKNDQLIMDYRSSDRLNVVKLTFKPCNAAVCGEDFDLTTFGANEQYLPAWDYDKEEHPCGERSYSGYVCQYDAVYDFKKMAKYLDKSVFVGQ